MPKMENAEVLTKKKTHRRKAGGKRKKDKNDRSLETTSDQEPIAAEEASQTERQLLEDGEPLRKHFKMLHKDNPPRHPLLHPHKLGARGRRLLRPAKVPKAPQNSTQFIIDDHENSAYFIDFDKGFTPPGARDDVGWSPYFQQDFENVYRTTREAETIDWTQEDLVEKISSLEERVKNLEQQLSMCDSNVYMSQLQHRIVCMQDKNRRIKEFRIWCPMHGKKVRLRNPSSETSSEDCSSSSSQSPDEDEEVVQNGESDSSEDEDVTEEDVDEDVNERLNPLSSSRAEDVEEEENEKLGERTGSVQSNDEIISEEP